MRSLRIATTYRRLLGLSAFALCQQAWAEYPEKAIQLFLPFKSLNGDSAQIAAEFAPLLSKHLNVPVKIEIFPVKGNSVLAAHEKLSQMPADGYVLFFASSFDLTAYYAVGALNDSHFEQLDYLDLITKQPLVCVTHPNSPYKQFDNFAQALRTRPQTLTHASWHISSQLYPTFFMKLLGANFHQVKKYVAKAVENPIEMVKENKADFNCWTFNTVATQLKEGTLSPIFTNSFVSFSEFPKIPKASELGIKEAERYMHWTLLVGPKGMPKNVREKIKLALDKIARDPAWLNSKSIKFGFNTIGKTVDVKKFVYEERDFYEKMAVFGRIGEP